MARGGSRPGAGRKKETRPTNQTVAAKVLAQANAQTLWLDLINLEKRRLGLDEAKGDEGVAINEGEHQGKFSIIPLTNLLRYLEDRAYGRPVDTVNHVHDKPIDLNVNLSLAETIRQVRQRKQDYERSRG